MGRRSGLSAVEFSLSRQKKKKYKESLAGKPLAELLWVPVGGRTATRNRSATTYLQHSVCWQLGRLAAKLKPD